MQITQENEDKFLMVIGRKELVLIMRAMASHSLVTNMVAKLQMQDSLPGLETIKELEKFSKELKKWNS